MTIRTRVTLFGVAVVTVVICCLSASLFGLISSGLDTDRDKQLAARADEAVASLASAEAADFTASHALTPIDPRESIDMFVQVQTADAQVVSATGAIDGQPVIVPAEVLAEATRTGAAATSVALPGGAEGERLRVQVRPWTRTDLGLSGHVIVAQTSRRVTQDRAGLLVLFGVSGVITFAAAAVAIYLATGRALRPLGRMAAMADEVGRSPDLDARLPPVHTRDPVGRLTTSFNAMLDRLQQAYAHLSTALAAQRRFTADASHELRTPLTAIRNNAEFLLQHPEARIDDRDAAVRDIAGETVRLGRLVESLLTLARADGGLAVRREAVDLAEVVAPVCRLAGTQHPDRALRFAATPARAVVGDADLLCQLVWILLDNAVKFTDPQGQIWVAVTQRGATVVLTVADDGVGIPAGAAQRIFDRFYRADPARSGAGAGLGLAIADWIVREHGGAILADNNDMGGATFSVELPAAPRTGEATVRLPSATGSAGTPGHRA